MCTSAVDGINLHEAFGNSCRLARMRAEVHEGWAGRSTVDRVEQVGWADGSAGRRRGRSVAGAAPVVLRPVEHVC